MDAFTSNRPEFIQGKTFPVFQTLFKKIGLRNPITMSIDGVVIQNRVADPHADNQLIKPSQLCTQFTAVLHDNNIYIYIYLDYLEKDQSNDVRHYIILY